MYFIDNYLPLCQISSRSFQPILFERLTNVNPYILSHLDKNSTDISANLRWFWLSHSLGEKYSPEHGLIRHGVDCGPPRVPPEAGCRGVFKWKHLILWPGPGSCVPKELEIQRDFQLRQQKKKGEKYCLSELLSVLEPFVPQHILFHTFLMLHVILKKQFLSYFQS